MDTVSIDAVIDANMALDAWQDAQARANKR